MAENQDAGLNIEVNAVANKKSAEQAVNELTSGVQQAAKKGRIEVPVDITVPIDNTKKKLTEAQKDITSEISKLMSKGFSASGKDIDTLTSKFDKFTKALDTAGKGRQNKIFREIRKQVEELQKSYRALKVETNRAKTHATKTSSTRKSTKKTAAKDRYLDQQEAYSKQAQGAGKRAALKKELAEVRENKSPIKSSGDIKPGKTNDHLVRLSEYSAHGSNWANELATILKEEVAKAEKTLVTYIDPSYKNRTENGRKTTEQEYLTDTFNKVRKELKDSIAQLEAGNKDITLDTLKEQAAVMKVLNKALGKTTENTEMAITSAIQGRYSDNTKKRLGGTSLEEGQKKGVGPGHENTKKLISQLYKAMKQWDNEIIADTISKEMALGINKAKKTSKRTTKADEAIANTKSSESYKAELNKLNGATEEVFTAIRKGNNETEKVNRSVKIGNTKEAVDSGNEQKIDKENKDINRDTAKTVKSDATTGFNTDSKAEELIQLVANILSVLQGLVPKTPLALPESTVGEKSLGELKNIFKSAGLSKEQIQQNLADISNSRKGKINEPKGPVTNGPTPPKGLTGEKEPYKNQVKKSNIYASPFRQGVWKSLEDAFIHLTGAAKGYEKILQANADEQDQMAAERIKTYGLNNGRNPNDTGDIAGMRRILQLYRTNKASIEQNPELMQKIKLTPGREVDTTELTKTLNKALSGREMQNAQNGGGFFKNLFGFATGGLGYAFMPSLEKSRAQADGLNQMFANINKALQTVLINIQTKETELSGMEASGQAKFDKDGYLTSDSSSAAFKTLADLEEEKLVLDSIEADLLANDEIVKKTGGKYSLLVKYLNFTSPVLKENNGILRNINSGLDKNGKALKFQTRLAEILNYTYQLMSRSIGQVIKNWISLINPVNLIKKAFSDFTSYNVKWQRTMNVVKYNLRAIGRTLMDDIAQKLVNIIGFFDIISMKVQAAFGKMPISLFDQAAADSEKMKEDLEAGANATAGFDELHDIGSDNSGANDLLGEIYKPKLSPEWQKLAEDIGDLFAHVIKGDMGFGEVMATIVKLLGEALTLIAKTIWNWFKSTAIGKYITEHWKDILATILKVFLAWKLLKLAGKLLFNALFGDFTESGIADVFSKVGGWITSLLGKSAFGRGIMEGVTSLFSGGGGLLSTMKSIFVGHDAITAFGAWGETLGALFAQSLLAVAGAALAGFAIAKGSDKMKKNTAYNVGLKEAGGDDKDKKSNVGATIGTTLGTTAGGALAGLAIGGPLGAAIGAGIGAIAGILTSTLAPALEKAEIAARNMNNELQKIEYYEGQVQGAQTQVDKFDELLELSNNTLQAQSDKVYALGEKYGVSSTKLDTLIQAMKDGNYNSEMAVGLNGELVTALSQLDWQYQNNASLTDKLTEAKKKLQKAELDLAIANDVEAGNFELAAARIEYAMSAGLYETDEAAQKMTQIMKKTSFTEAQELLNNCSPELQAKWNEYTSDIEQGKKDITEIFGNMSEEERKSLLNSNNEGLKQKWFTYATTTKEGKKELAKMYADMNEDERKAFTKDYSSEAGGAMGKAIKAMQDKINNATFDWSHPFKSLGSMFSGDWSWKAKYASFDVGTNYVPNDGFAYIHKGEAIIPKDENVFARQGKAWDSQATTNTQMINAISRLEQIISQGISVKGEFRQRGSDLVATVEKAKNRNGNQPLNNSVFAR